MKEISCLLAAFVHGAFGFGFPVLSTPLLAFGFDLRTAILLTLVPTVSINLVSILTERHWREALRDYWPIPAFTIVGSFLGTQVLLEVDPEPFRMLLAVMMIGYLVSEHLHRGQNLVQVPRWGMGLFGLVLGLFAGAGLSVAGEALPQLSGSMRSIWAAAGSTSATSRFRSRLAKSPPLFGVSIRPGRAC